ncbi:MAG TPA: fructosamine kinase family protein [Phototrophicaceae bacterium]|jgi:fructosamine-3-kinase|nr:fructosamine kinase family protein [Phototrophicaceae bacterium]
MPARNCVLELQNQITVALDKPCLELKRLQGGSIAEVYAARLNDSEWVVAKASSQTSWQEGEGNLPLEGMMLRYLRECSPLPVPDVLYADPRLLIMSKIKGESEFNHREQIHAAELIAQLHSITQSHYGFKQNTLIGSLNQPNPLTEYWIPFFRDHRLLYMAKEAVKAGQLSLALYRRIDALAGKLEKWLLEPTQPALLHGDLWTTNILAKDGKITGFLDPGIYYGHPEIELAFTTLFNTFGRPFFERYQDFHPLQPGFFEERRDLYNLYPLLVHVRLFGSGYVPPIEMTLRRFGV